MSKHYDEDYLFNPVSLVAAGIGILFAIVTMVWGSCALGRCYDVWAQGKHGEAELARAESNRSIKTLEAKAKMESSKHMAEAEVIRARGVAEANRIIGDSLKENEGYLRYLWIHNLAESSNQVIYVPTEANLPILEANRLKQGVQSW
jgi:regulator of protease activity HflC (stomatin/prohibitin superfamily)